MPSLRQTSLALLAAAVFGMSQAAAEAPLFLVDSPFTSDQTTISQLDTATGAMRLVADLGSDFSPVLGLAAASGRVLYATGTDTSSADTCLGMRSCLLLRIELNPDSSTPKDVTIVGPVHTGSGVVSEITGLGFRSDGTLIASSQETDSVYTVDPDNARARSLGRLDLDLHGADSTLDRRGRVWTWSNIGDASGLYLVEEKQAQASAFQLHPGIFIAGLAAVGHEGRLYASRPSGDRLLGFSPVTGLLEVDMPLRLHGEPFDHARGDLDSPFCRDDAACDDGNPDTSDRCTPGGCSHRDLGDIEDLCPCEGPGRPWRNHGEYVRCVAREGARLRSGGRALVSEAARSQCGTPVAGAAAVTGRAASRGRR